jgi:hypothetical protein
MVHNTVFDDRIEALTEKYDNEELTAKEYSNAVNDLEEEFEG